MKSQREELYILPNADSKFVYYFGHGTTSQNFYLEYVFESRKGRFFTDIAFQSKNDKKFNHVPLYYFVRGEQYKIFSSYGTNNQKDIYFSKKISSD